MRQHCNEWQAFCLFLALPLLLGAATVASQVNDVRVVQTAAHQTRIVVTSSAAIAGWKLIGAGTTDIALVLPNTSVASPPPVLAHATGSVSSFDFTANGTQLYATFHLTGLVTATAAQSGSTITIVLKDSGRSPVQRTQQPQVHTAQSANAPSFEVIPLKYADVSEVAGILVAGQQMTPNDLFQTQGSIFTLPSSANGAQPLQNQQTYSNLAQPSQPQSFGEKLNDNIAVDRRLNAIVLSGTPQQIAQYKAVIQAIDVPLQSVMLECQVVELSETAARDLGLELSTGAGSPVVSGGAEIVSGQMPVFRATLQANLFATIAKGGGKILATPRVLALSGMSAQILTGDALPIIQTTIFPGSPTVTQVTTNYIAVGVNLQIQPRITVDGNVTSHIFAEVSSVTAYVPTTQGNVPQISLRQATTSATVADGTPFVIGGLLRDEEISNMSKIPVLGDLPIIGGLFRTRHDTSTRTNLFVIITPHIIAASKHSTSQ